MDSSSIISTELFRPNLTDYLTYSIYTENENNLDEPEEGKFRLYDLFDDAISCLNEDKEITISEKISSKTEILSTDNYNQITSIFGVVTPEIDYEGINALLSKINNKQSYSEISTTIMSWLGKFVNLSVNRNPENADESNYILVQALLKPDESGQCYIQKLTEALLNKIFRNLVQLVRVKHEYRLYGQGTTIFGGKSTELSSATKLRDWSGLNPSCWSQFTGNYIVGKSAYGENISSISSTINGTFDINPSTCYGIASHTHQVSVSKASVPDTVEMGTFSVVTAYPIVEADRGYKARYVKEVESSTHTDWKTAASRVLQGNPRGFADGTETSGKVVGGGSWNYFWKSNNCYLTTTKDMQSDIFKAKDTILPTYATYVWQWTGVDDTNITSPKAFIREATGA